MKNKQILTAIAFSLLLSCYSCSESSDTAETTQTETQIQSQSFQNAESTSENIFDTLPERDFGGETFTFYIPPNPDSPVDKGTFAEELNGEAFNDAVYQRNMSVEDKYNVKIDFVFGASWSSTYDDLKPSVLAGDVPCDVYFTHVQAGTANMVSEGLLREWTDVPHINFEKPWWNHQIIKNLNIANRTFYAASSLSIQEPLVLLFNKTMIESYGLENPYELVRQGKWTIDKLSEMAEAVSMDLNGDGKFDKEDQYGLEYGTVWQVPSLMYACGETTIVIDENGYPNLNIDSEKMYNIYDKISKLLYDGNKTYCYSGTVEETANIPHIGIDSGRVLFCQWNLFSCEKLREAEVDYGIIPLPKYDEAQENYVSNSWTGMYGIPVTASEEELDRIGIMMESMSALGYTDVVPVYYDNVLKNKTSRDVDSCEMLDIILAGLTYDVGLNFQIGTSAGTFMSSCIVNKQDYASSVAKNTKSMTKMYDKFYNTVLELDSAN